MQDGEHRSSQDEILNQLLEQVKALSDRVSALEARQSASAAKPSPPPPKAILVSETPPAPSPPPSSLPRPSFTDAEVKSQPVSRQSQEAGRFDFTSSVEEFLGGKVALWVGSLAVFLAMAFLLAYTWGYLGTSGRLAVGAVAGTVMLALGAVSRGRTDRWFAEGLSGAALAVFYLTVWAATQVYRVLPFESAFVLMATVTMIGVALSLVYDAVSLIVLATVGGFLTPAILQSSGAGGSPVPFLTYVALLEAGVLAVSVYKAWRPVVWLAMVFTALLLIGWSSALNVDPIRWILLAYITGYFLMFNAAWTFRLFARGEESTETDIIGLTLAGLIYTLAGFVLTFNLLGDYPGLFPASLAGFYGLSAAAVKRRCPANRLLMQFCQAAAIAFATAVVPVQFHRQDYLIGILWSLEAGALVTLGNSPDRKLLRRSGQVVWILSAIMAFGVAIQGAGDSGASRLSPEALHILIFTAVCWWLAAITRYGGDNPDEAASLYQIFAVLAGAVFFALLLKPTVQVRMSFIYSALAAAAVYLAAAFWAGLYGRMGTVRLTSTLGLQVVGLGAFFCWVYELMSEAPLLDPILNMRAAAFVVVAAGCWTASGISRYRRSVLGDDEFRWMEGQWLTGAVIALTGLTIEVLNTAYGLRLTGETVETAAFYLVSAVWSCYAVGAVAAGRCLKSQPLLWFSLLLTLLAGFLAGFPALSALYDHGRELRPLLWKPFFNFRALAYLTSVASLGIVAAAVRNSLKVRGSAAKHIAGVFALLACAALLAALTHETFETMRCNSASLGANWKLIAQMSISVLWVFYGLLILVIGIVRNTQEVRLLALAVLGIAAAKVFLFDLSFLDTPLRMLVFLILGLALMGIAFRYSRIRGGALPGE